jgi:hypothetical protein
LAQNQNLWKIYPNPLKSHHNPSKYGANMEHDCCKTYLEPFCTTK